MSNRAKDLTVFIRRMEKLDISIELAGNSPWIYIDKINGVRVVEKFQANHGFTIAFYPNKPEDNIKLTDITEIFKLIRKYI